MENIEQILKLLIIAVLAIGYLVKIFKGEKANDILGSLIKSIEYIGTPKLKKDLSSAMTVTDQGNEIALDDIVQKVTKGKTGSKIWKAIKFIAPFVL